jgi:hypothetical protein
MPYHYQYFTFLIRKVEIILDKATGFTPEWDIEYSFLGVVLFLSKYFGL